MPKPPQTFKWKHLSRAEELSLTPEQKVWVLQYLTTAPDIPQFLITVTVPLIPGEIPDVNFKHTEEELSSIGQHWDGDGLIRWVCQNTRATTGAKLLTPEGKVRALSLYQGLPEDALFLKPQPYDDSGIGSPSFVHFLRNYRVSENGWPKQLSPSQEDIIDGHIQDRADQEHGPAKSIFRKWARLMIHEERLSVTFNAAEFVVLVAKRPKTKQYLTPEALAWLSHATPALAWNLPQRPDTEPVLAGVPGSQADTSKDTKRKRAEELNAKGRLAADVGATDWQQLEIKVLATGIKFRKEGTGDEFLQKDWGAIQLKGKHKVYSLLIAIAKHGGTYPKKSGENRRNPVHTLNTAFKSVFGLSGLPFSNVRTPLGTQGLIGSISWGGRP